MTLGNVLAVAGGAAIVMLLLVSSAHVISEFERGIVFRWGRLRPRTRGPGLTFVVPVMDRLDTVNTQDTTMPVPAQQSTTRDNATVDVDALLCYRVVDPVRVAVSVQNHEIAISQIAQISMRSLVTQCSCSELIRGRERLNERLVEMISRAVRDWGVRIEWVNTSITSALRIPKAHLRVEVAAPAAPTRQPTSKTLIPDAARQPALTRWHRSLSTQVLQFVVSTPVRPKPVTAADQVSKSLNTIGDIVDECGRQSFPGERSAVEPVGAGHVVDR